jgi:hypothetical protein
MGFEIRYEYVLAKPEQIQKREEDNILTHHIVDADIHMCNKIMENGTSVLVNDKFNNNFYPKRMAISKVTRYLEKY